MFKIVENITRSAVIKVIGIGGGGGNALEHMIGRGIDGVEFISTNTDAQALGRSKADVTLQLGESVTHGLGAGADPAVGREAAIEARDNICAALKGADMVFIAAGMGGGTGTGAAPVIAEIASEINSLTVAVVTKPFPFERDQRMQIALGGIEELNKHVDSLITIPNEKLITVLGKDRPMVEAFKEADDVLLSAVQGIAELITREGLVNLDFADVKKVMSNTGMAMMGNGSASGENRAYEAAHAAINNPLLEDVDLTNACGVLVNIMAGTDLTMGEFDEIGSCMSELAAADASVVIGTVIDESMGDQLRVTLVATGLGGVPATAAGPVAHAEPLTDQPVAVLPQPELAPVPGSASGPASGPDYGGYDAPAVKRRPDCAGDGGRENPDEEYSKYLDIPAFLRHQVD